MPHIILEYSKGLAASLDIELLLRELHDCAIQIKALPTGGIRTRAYGPISSFVGDGKGGRDFIYITVRLGQGRAEDTKRDIGDRLFAVLTDFTDHKFRRGEGLSLGLEIQEIEKDWTWKKNNIHQILKDKN